MSEITKELYSMITDAPTASRDPLKGIEGWIPNLIAEMRENGYRAAMELDCIAACMAIYGPMQQALSQSEFQELSRLARKVRTWLKSYQPMPPCLGNIMAQANNAGAIEW